MCGIAGLIHRDGATGVGKEMTAMLLSLRHRGPDSTGFAIYGVSAPDYYVMRLKLAEQEDLGRDPSIREKIRSRQAKVDERLAEIGAVTVKATEVTPYAYRYQLRYAGDTKLLANDIEQIEGASNAGQARDSVRVETKEGLLRLHSILFAGRPGAGELRQHAVKPQYRGQDCPNPQFIDRSLGNFAHWLTAESVAERSGGRVRADRGEKSQRPCPASAAVPCADLSLPIVNQDVSKDCRESCGTEQYRPRIRCLRVVRGD